MPELASVPLIWHLSPVLIPSTTLLQSTHSMLRKSLETCSYDNDLTLLNSMGGQLKPLTFFKPTARCMLRGERVWPWDDTENVKGGIGIFGKSTFQTVKLRRQGLWTSVPVLDVIGSKWQKIPERDVHRSKTFKQVARSPHQRIRQDGINRTLHWE